MRLPMRSARLARPPRYIRTRITIGTLLALGVTGCESVLDVDNPNNVVEEAITPAASAAMANGVEASTARALGAILAPYSTVTDELDWVGSRDGWQQLDFGNVSEPNNEFTDAAFPYVAEARWFADETAARLKRYADDGALRNPIDLARTYIYGAIIYSTIADMFDDFAFSNRQEPAPPVGEANMGALYDKAIEYLNQALPIATAAGDDDLRFAILGTRARVKHGKAVWAKLNPAGTTPANPLVNDAGAVADANAALALASGPADAYELELVPGLVVGDLSMALQVNSRQEMRIGEEFAFPDPNRRTRAGATKLRDPIDDVPDPRVTANVAAYHEAGLYAPNVIFSVRELHLILAEAALAAGNMAGFTANINAVRDDFGLTPYSGQIPAIEMLKHERRVNLMFTGRRLADLYRFGGKAERWQSSSHAASKPGSFFPITVRERLANPCVADPSRC